MPKKASDEDFKFSSSLAEPSIREQEQSSSLSDSLSLSDVSPRDYPWDKHRYESDLVQNHYEDSEFQRYADRMQSCAGLLDFRLVSHSSPQGSQEYRLKLSSAFFCHVRHCVVCQWRKSLRTKARAFNALPRIIKDFPSARFLFLTLTIKNCKVSDLRETISHMNKSWQRLSQLKDFPSVGYLRTTEVTRGRDNISAHPHFHALIMVKPSYFGVGYLSQKKWSTMWQKSLRVDYQPIVDIQALKKGACVTPLLAEICKYSTKPSTVCYVPDKEWFLELTRQLHRTKFLSLGGILKDYFKELTKEITDEEMIHADGKEESDPDEGFLRFGWRYWERKYRLIE